MILVAGSLQVMRYVVGGCQHVCLYDIYALDFLVEFPLCMLSWTGKVRNSHCSGLCQQHVIKSTMVGRLISFNVFPVIVTWRVVRVSEND